MQHIAGYCKGLDVTIRLCAVQSSRYIALKSAKKNSQGGPLNVKE